MPKYNNSEPWVGPAIVWSVVFGIIIALFVLVIKYAGSVPPASSIIAEPFTAKLILNS